MKRNRDIALYLVRDPACWSGEAFTFRTLKEAHEFWAEDTSREAYLLFPAEGRMSDLTDDFEEILDEAAIDARAIRRENERMQRDARVAS